MKARTLFLALFGGLFLALNVASAQGTAFTYQGRLLDGGTPADGAYDLQLTIYDARTGGNAIAGPLTNSPTAVSNGLFTVTLDFGIGVFTGAPRWLEIGVRTNGGAVFATLNPRQELTPSPYAILAGDVALGNTNVARLNVPNTATTATGVPVVNNGFVIAANVTSGGSGYTTAPPVTVNDTTGTGAFITSTISNGAVVSLTVHNAGSGYSSNASLTIGPPPSNAYQAFVSTNFFTGVNYLTNANNVFTGNGAGLTNLNAWQLNGNLGTLAGPNFVGTVDNQSLELHVNGQRALRLEPTTNISAVNIVGGSSVNGVDLGVVGATIAGGGTANYNGTPFPNHIGGSYSTVGGGGSNSIAPGSTYATIAGGGANSISGGLSGTIGGGVFNALQANDCLIAGGFGNFIQSDANGAAIGGGYNNTTTSYASTVSGGQGNFIGTNSYWGVIGGGSQNSIQPYSASATIAGGGSNTIQTNAPNAFIGGGYGNTIQTNCAYSFIGGGYGNMVDGGAQVATIGGGGTFGFTNHISATLATIAGGSGNTIQADANDSTIAGGRQNEIDTGAWGAFIGGGHGNLIQAGSNPGGASGNSSYSIINGGFGNLIQSNANYAVIAGGAFNSIQGDATESFIGGGGVNTIGANCLESTITGGAVNAIQAGSYRSVVSGGYVNVVGGGSYGGTIAGGEYNNVQLNAPNSAIGGGLGNTVQTNAAASIIAGGQYNTIQSTATNSSTIGGGLSNTVSAAFATVPGGFQNTAAGDFSLAAGNRAKANHAGAFVWADSQAADFNSVRADVFQVRCRGGVEFTSGSAALNQTVGWTPGSGAWAFSSDRNLKDRITPVDTQSVLEKVSRLPLAEWSYIGYEQRHIGPMAQDFHALFPLNDNDKMLNELDVQGVALAAIQGLSRKLQDTLATKEVEIQQLKAQNDRLEQRLDQLARRLEALVEQR